METIEKLEMGDNKTGTKLFIIMFIAVLVIVAVLAATGVLHLPSFKESY